jgi:hypothetical protein
MYICAKRAFRILGYVKDYEKHRESEKLRALCRTMVIAKVDS